MLAILTLSTGVTASRLEESDRFCASCHMTPERTYYNRAQFALAGVEPADLASAHYQAKPGDLPHEGGFRCIDCHRGDESLPQRMLAFAVGGRDVATYFLGEPDQAFEKRTADAPVLVTESCVRCHAASLLVVGFPNHYHNKLPAAYQAWRGGAALSLPVEDPALYVPDLEKGLERLDIDLVCMDCHPSHTQMVGGALTSFVDLENVVYPACERCHREVLGAPVGLK